MSKIVSITAAILAGGLGMRLRPVVSKLPKVLAGVNKQPFLQILLDQLNSAGLEDVVICSGYLGDQIRKRFGAKYKNLKLTYSQEDTTLGTGGGLRLALHLLKSESILVMNGDSFCDVNLKGFLAFHLKKKADAALVLSYVKDAGRFGQVRTDSTDLILEFEEKKKSVDQGWINAGVYLLKHSLISKIPKGINISLETEIFPEWVGRSFYGYKSKGSFIDIGTPSSYKEAERFFAKKNNITRRFVLLDRDGTVIKERHYLSKPEDVELIPGAIEALRKLKQMGLGLVIITNQSGIGRGYFDIATLKKIHLRMTDLLKKRGVVLDDIYFCPHTPEDDCLCRKPNTGLVLQAMKKHNFDPKLCFVVGDKKADIELGKKIGATTVLVKTGYGSEVAKGNNAKPDHIADDLLHAFKIIKSCFKTS